jgi:hypothetical protein
LTSNLARLSYARVLVEIDLLEELLHYIDVLLPNGSTLHQKVIYETLPKFCKHCHVLGHSNLLCPKTAAVANKENGNVAKGNLPMESQATAHEKNLTQGNVFSRPGP